MSKIMFFCIPAWGHTNPTLPVVRELVRRGHQVRYYSFEPFRQKIEQTGAVFVGCDDYLPPLDKGEEKKLRRVSTTMLTVKDFQITASMDAMLTKEVEAFRPDGIVADSVCFWGKLIARKFSLPFVCSTSTFAFNRWSSKYMKQSALELADMILGLPIVTAALWRLRPLGYRVSNPLSIVQNDNETHTIVYTSQHFQPCADTFSDKYAFVGPSLTDAPAPVRGRARKKVYVSLGTVNNQYVGFYRACLQALGGMDVDAVLSVGTETDVTALGTPPANVQVFPRVEQLSVLAGTDVFLTHCGMNSVSESLYLGVPMALYPKTAEQYAVARRVCEVGAGEMLCGDSAEAIRATLHKLLDDEKYAAAACAMREAFLRCSGPAGAADKVEAVIAAK